MARRKSEQAQGASMDSLMDTLTNVVGILIIILILVQINVSQQLKKIISELPPATAEEVQKLQEQAKKLATDQDTLKDQVEQMKEQIEKDKAELKKLTPELAALETREKASAVPMLDVDTLQKKLDEQKKLLEKKKPEMAALLDEQQRLKAVLDTTPVVTGPATKVVRIPNSRPIPEKANIERYLITGGQLFYLDMEQAKKLVLADFNSAKQRLEREKVKGADGSRKTIYDHEKIVQHFTQRRLSLRNLDIKVPLNKTATRMQVQLLPKPGLGEPIQAAAQITSRFANDLRRFKGTNSVVWLHVARDDFETYLRARDICDALAVPVGWDAVNTPAYAESIPDIEVNRLEEPKPVDPNALIIAPPKKKLD